MGVCQGLDQKTERGLTIQVKQVASVSLVSVIYLRAKGLYVEVASSSQIKLKSPLSWNNPAPVLSQLEIGSSFQLISRVTYVIISGVIQKQPEILVSLLTC